MEQAKILNVHESPFKHNPALSALFSTLPLDDNTLPWLFQFFMNISGNKIAHINRDASMVYTLYTNTISNYTNARNMCPYISNQIYDLNFLSSLDKYDITDLLTMLISNGKYIYTQVNCKYISAYNNYPYAHPLFIYGYSKNENVFYVGDYFDGIYKRISVTFSELSAGLNKIPETYNPRGDMLKGLLAWSISEASSRTELDHEAVLAIIKNNVCMILESTNIFGLYKYSVESYNGMAVYDHIIISTKETLIKMDNWINHRMYTLLLCHLKVITMCSEYLCRHINLDQTIYEKSKQALDQMQICLNLVVKSNLVKNSNEKLIGRIIDGCMKCKSLENDVLQSICDTI